MTLENKKSAPIGSPGVPSRSFSACPTFYNQPTATLADVKRAIRDKYAWPGGYPLYLITMDGEALSIEAAQENWRQICSAHMCAPDKQWAIAAVDINWEDENLFCAHSSQKIECAYPGQGEFITFEEFGVTAVLMVNQNGATIEQFSSYSKGVGNARRALEKLRATYGDLTVPGIGREGTEPYEFWMHCFEVNLVQVLRDDNGALIKARFGA